MKKFLILSRAPFFAAIILPHLYASALAFHNGYTINWTIFAISLIALVLAHAGANLFNDYYDFKLGADIDNKNRNQFSGGSPHIAEGSERPNTFLYFGCLSFLITFTLWIFLIYEIDKGVGPIVYFGLLGFFCGFFYTAPPLKLAYRGWGEILIFFAFGILPITGVYYLQSKQLSIQTALAGIPIALLILNIIWINQFPDYESDKKAGKKNWVVKLNKNKSIYVYHLISALTFLSVLCLFSNSTINGWSLMSLLGLPLAITASIILHNNYNFPTKMQKAQGMTILTLIVTGSLLTIGLII